MAVLNSNGIIEFFTVLHMSWTKATTSKALPTSPRARWNARGRYTFDLQISSTSRNLVVMRYVFSIDDGIASISSRLSGSRSFK
ncbi:hypothetical protein DQ04_11681000 [Trypanosoma grayi]|uniref:hypothetical protein n=1 Tax=Trypanosoma grayi TaxID=71804 RepID=UPI0004F40E0C|nr:hypothetical protein DQ04_11681000 [Trypanosoma grayi]KEG06910.1 hypothetical protein DQ04_11681000 [Trypanosoma grayi]